MCAHLSAFYSYYFYQHFPYQASPRVSAAAGQGTPGALLRHRATSDGASPGPCPEKGEKNHIKYCPSKAKVSLLWLAHFLNPSAHPTPKQKRKTEQTHPNPSTFRILREVFLIATSSAVFLYYPAEQNFTLYSSLPPNYSKTH